MWYLWVRVKGVRFRIQSQGLGLRTQALGLDFLMFARSGCKIHDGP